jgi:CheY-like chemotaxis protein
MKPTDLNYEVVQIYNLLKRTIPQMIEIELKLGDAPHTINADTSQLGQLIMNLSVNARDAMPEGGKLIFETANCVLDEKFCESPEGTGALPGQYVRLSISDTGMGMTKQCMDHIYEPFFTTKEVGKGTGLGLAIVYGIINSHKGHIVCKSMVGKGTTFDVYFPALPASYQYDPDEVVDLKVSGSETLLLVDDDESVRNLGFEMLSKLGYQVITATDGESAIKQYKSRKNEIDMILLDLLMPGMGGHKCLEQLLKVNPEAKILIASGHAGNDDTGNRIVAKAAGFVSKPYKVNEISKAIRNILDGRAL